MLSLAKVYQVPRSIDLICSRYSALTSITIGNGVTSIGDRAFARCENLSAVIFLGDAPKLNEWKDIINGGTTAGSLGATPTIYRKPEAKGWRKLGVADRLS